MPIIGLTGPNASGKGEVAAYLESRGYKVFSLSDVIREALAERDEEPTRERMIDTGTALRRAHGPGVLAERLAGRLVDRNIVDSIRNPSEVAALREVPGFVLWLIDAPPALRFERSCRRGRVGDAETLERFIELEARENTSDPSAQQLSATAALADDRLENDADLPALHARIDRRLAQLEMIESDDFREAVARLRRAQRVVVITGAGVSAESGVELFRSGDAGGGGLWDTHDVEDVATASALARDPAKVWRFLLELRATYGDAKPNAGHDALAKMAERFESFRVITQNIDGLHQAAGSRDVLEIHGNAATARNQTTGEVVAIDALDLSTMPPASPGSDDAFRPNVVYFEEAYDPAIIGKAQTWVEGAEVILVVGTSGVVPTPYWLADLGRSVGAYIIEVNPSPSAEARALANAVLAGRGGAALPALARAIAGPD